MEIKLYSFHPLQAQVTTKKGFVYLYQTLKKFKSLRSSFSSSQEIKSKRYKNIDIIYLRTTKIYLEIR